MGARMTHPEVQPDSLGTVFLDREAAGRKLAKALREYRGSGLAVAAIPRGGIPVGLQLALQLGCQMDLVIPCKLPIPWNPEAGFGAITADGAVVLNRAMVKALGLLDEEVEAIADRQREELRRRIETYSRMLAPLDLRDRPVAVVDDGLASGYTMLAAVESVRMQQPAELIVAVPVASSSSARLVEGVVDRLICLTVSSELPFAVADFYVDWHDLTEQDVARYLKAARGTRRNAKCRSIGSSRVSD